MRTIRAVGIFATALLLAGACGHPISRPLRAAAQKDPALFTTVLADPASFRGKTVLWGGRVIEITNMKTGTEMIVLENPLDLFGAPQATKSWRGRFIARLSVFLDPAVYLADRDITLAGEIMGGEEREVGETLYKYPVVRIKELYLWEKLSPPYPADSWRDSM